MAQHKDANGRGKPGFGAARLVNFGGQRVERCAAPFGDLAERLPELIFERYAGAMSAQGERAFDGASAHASSRLWASWSLVVLSLLALSSALSDLRRPCRT